MPRTLSASAMAVLNAKVGIEAINIVEVQWVKDGQYYYYSDRRFPETHGKLMDISDLESVINVEKSGSSTAISIKLEDTDGTLKHIFNYNDIHNRPVKVYQWFTGIPWNDKFVIFEGQVASPIRWDEGKRTLDFDVLSRLNDREVGFSVEEGDFVNVSELLLGKPWPLVFGTVQNMPTVQMDEIPTGTIKIAIGIADETITKQVAYYNLRANEMVARGNCFSARAAELKLFGSFGLGSGNSRQLYEQGQALQRQADELHKQARELIWEDMQRLQQIETEQKAFDATVIPIMGGDKFRQGVLVSLDINGANYVGRFQGENFMVQSRRPPKKPYHRDPETGEIDSSHEWTYTIVGNTQEEHDARFADFLFGSDGSSNSDKGGTQTREGDPCAPPHFYIIHTLPEPNARPQEKGEYFHANAGSAVKIVGNYPIRYIISIIPGVSVIHLSSKRNVNGLKIITPIPPWYYKIYTMTFGSVVATVAEFAMPLSSIESGVVGAPGPDWEDEVYATVTSPIGPNVVDIMTYLIQTYTDFGIDATTFNYVRTKVANYPANFALLTRPNIVTLLKEIAFQARCSIWLASGKFYLKYLPEQAPTVENISEDCVVPGSLEVITTNTEDLVTKLIATWRDDYSKSEPNKVITRYNIGKYGTYEQTFDFYIYNHVDLVVKSATFWLIRMSNIWKKIVCEVYIDKLKIETLDSVEVIFNQNFVADVNFAGVVEKASFSSEDLTIGLEIWTPVRLGEMIPYIFAYPAGVDVSLIFPTEEDEQAGYVSDTVHQDASGDLRSTFKITTQSIKGGTYRTNPSDQYDAEQPTIPTIQIVSGYEPQSGLPPVGSALNNTGATASTPTAPSGSATTTSTTTTAPVNSSKVTGNLITSPNPSTGATTVSIQIANGEIITLPAYTTINTPQGTVQTTPQGTVTPVPSGTVQPAPSTSATVPLPTGQVTASFQPGSAVIAPAANGVPVGRAPVFDYNYNGLDSDVVNARSRGGNPNVYQPTTGTRTYAARVVAHLEGDSYTIEYYPHGRNGEGVQTNAVQLQIDSSQELEPDTWGIVVENVWYEDNEPQVEHQFQVPVWNA